MRVFRVPLTLDLRFLWSSSMFLKSRELDLLSQLNKNLSQLTGG